jgi:O-antigen biosynthesis protein
MAGKFSTLFLAHTGKASDKWASYLPVYDAVFGKYQDKEDFSLLEIGIQNGGSLEVYSQFFQGLKIIVGCDINPACGELVYEDARVNIVIGNCATSSVCDEINRICAQYDIIIDDGSHTSQDIVRAFLMYFSKLKPGGSFIIEDLHASYWGEWGGGLFYGKSSMSFLKLLLDVIHHEHWGIDAANHDVLVKEFPEYKDLIMNAGIDEICSISFFNSICVVEKSSHSTSQALGERRVAGKYAQVDEVPLSQNGGDPRRADERSNMYSRLHSTEPPSDTRPISRNGLCPCGSGKRFKHCHGKLA